MKKKINIQFIGISIIGILATMLLITNIFYELFEKEVLNDIRIDLGIIKNTKIENVEDIKKLNIDSSELRITLIANDGTVLYDNEVDISALDNHKDRPEVIQAKTEGFGKQIRTSDTLGKSIFYSAILLDNGMVLRGSKEASNIIYLFQSVVPTILFIILVMIIIVIIASCTITNNLIKPIEKIANDIEKHSIFTDVSEYKEIEPFINTIKKQYDDILKSSVIRQEFTANVSHELKTPLTAISGYAELIENNIVKGEEVHHFSKEIRNNANRLLILINDIIRLSELDNIDEKAKLERIDLYEVVKSNLEDIKVNAKKNNITVSCSGMSVKILGNKFMISEVITNLCDNAIRYNVKDGMVNIEVFKEENNAILKITDTGIGIPKEHIDRIFERFYRVDKSRSKETGGTGLGLSIVKHILELHKATIEVQSQEGKGTYMKVTFFN